MILTTSCVRLLNEVSDAWCTRNDHCATGQTKISFHSERERVCESDCDRKEYRFSLIMITTNKKKKDGSVVLNFENYSMCVCVVSLANKVLAVGVIIVSALNL